MSGDCYPSTAASVSCLCATHSRPLHPSRGQQGQELSISASPEIPEKERGGREGRKEGGREEGRKDWFDSFALRCHGVSAECDCPYVRALRLLSVSIPRMQSKASQAEVSDTV